MSFKDFHATLEKTGLPVRYSHFSKPQAPPFLAYLMDGQEQFSADNTRHWHRDQYSLEYYFTEKNTDIENTIEETLLADGYRFTKEGDIYIDEESIFEIIYSIY